MTGRRQFLIALFEMLDHRAIPYCVLRNYEHLYDNPTSDVDLIVEPDRLEPFRECLHAAATATGYRLVHSARYVNFSHVYWRPGNEFIRIDFETEVRWRLFPVLTAKSVVGLRRRHGEFYIPHSRHESVIVFLAAIWRNELSDRYQTQLEQLFRELPDPADLPRTFDSAFGVVGAELAALQGRIREQKTDRAFWRRVKRSMYRASVTRRPQRRALLANLWTDVARLWERVRTPVGISFLFATSATSPRKMEASISQMEFLFPSKKGVVAALDLTGKKKASVRLTWRMRLTRLRTLFKGGLFIRLYHVSDDSQLNQVIRTHSRYLYPSRTFVGMEDSQGKVFFGHVSSGFMAAELPHEDGGTADFSGSLTRFIASTLARARPRLATTRAQHGVFAVILGVDGAGKTTMARELCCQALSSERFAGVRYYYWRARVGNRVEFPLPVTSETPGRQGTPRSPLNLALSTARLLVNALLARAVYLLTIQSLLERNYLVVVDRYYFNYLLDPASVGFHGSSRLLQRFMPLFPKPDAVITLEADVGLLSQRTQALSFEEIQRQAALLQSMEIHAACHVRSQAAQSSSEVARHALERLGEIAR